jgi:radical SAM superfamily enzyme YgiQ (UPF0313 family)
MRIVLANPQYPQTFWSFDKPLETIGKKIALPPLGLLTIAAHLPGNWELRLRDLPGQNMSEEDWEFCDLIMITGMVTQYSAMVELIREAKQRGKAVAVGGPLAFHVPEDLLKLGADVVVKGEIELAVPRLIETLERKESGVIIETPPRPGMEHCLPPRYDLADFSLYGSMAVQFSRGCPFHCEFCDITYMFGREVRTKSPEQILQELGVLYDLGWRGEILFVDDNFLGKPIKTKMLLKQLIPWMEKRSYPFRFQTQASVNLAADEEVLNLMVKAGFFRVFLGIETTDRESLNRTKKVQNVVMDLDHACQTINRAGLQVIAGCILGFDGERPGADQRLLDFATRNSIPEMFITLLQAGPGTDLWERLKVENRLLETRPEDTFGSQTGLMNFNPTRPVNQIVEEFLRLYDVLYQREFYLKRSYEHLLRMVQPTLDRHSPSLPEVRAVIKTLWRQGVVYSSRWTFWKMLFKGLLNFPKRMDTFFYYCVALEHYEEYRHTIKEQLTGKVAGS